MSAPSGIHIAINTWYKGELSVSVAASYLSIIWSTYVWAQYQLSFEDFRHPIGAGLSSELFWSFYIFRLFSIPFRSYLALAMLISHVQSDEK